MKKIYRIAKLELEIMFYSPIAWIVLTIVLVQTGLGFLELLYQQETNQQLERPLRVLTRILFSGENGILNNFKEYSYLYIPLLTMGLLSRELSSGSLKLLQSSPVTSAQIILGKYFSMMVYCFILILLFIPFIIAGVISIETLDTKFVLGGLFGLYLLICAYSAIGLYMSSLTTYQVVAVISTVAILEGFNYIGGVGQNYDFVREITNWLQISGRTDHFIIGLISLKDVFYFLLLISTFLILSIMRLNDERKLRSKLVKAIRYCGLLVIVISLGYITSMPTINGYYDTTNFKDRTLTENSQKLIKNLDKPISITTYVNVIDYTAGYGAPKNRINDRNKFESYRRFMPNLKMDYVFYYDSIMGYQKDTIKTLVQKAKEAAKAYHFNFDELLTPEEIRSKIDLIAEGNRLVRFVHYGDKVTPLRMFDDMISYPGEAEISAVLKRLTKGASQVAMLVGNDERSIYKKGNMSYKTIINGLNMRNSLLNQGFDSKEIDLNLTETIDENLDVLILADPKHSYSPSQLEKIEKYIASGGNLLITGEPGRQSVLNPIIQKMGVQFLEGTLLQESKVYELDLVQGKFTQEAKKLGYSYFSKAKVTLPTAMSMAVDTMASSFKITTILSSDLKSTWNKREPFNLDESKVVFDSLKEHRISPIIAVALERSIASKNQKIIIVGDADFMSNGELNRGNNVNASFVIRMMKWFSDGKYPVSTKRPATLDRKITVSRTEIFIMKGVLIVLIPLLLGVYGARILIRRKTK